MNLPFSYPRNDPLYDLLPTCMVSAMDIVATDNANVVNSRYSFIVIVFLSYNFLTIKVVT